MSGQLLISDALVHHAKTHGTGPAIRVHHRGLWTEHSWSELSDHVSRAAHGLATLGVGPGSLVGLFSRNKLEWIVADLAINHLGAATVAVHPDLSPTRAAALLGEHEVATVVVGDQEQLDALSENAESLSKLAHVIIVDTRGVRHFDDGAVHQIANGDVRTWTSLLSNSTSAPNASACHADALAVTLLRVTKIEGTSTEVETISRTNQELAQEAQLLTSRLKASRHDEFYPNSSFADPNERALLSLALHLGAPINIGQGGALATIERREVQPTISALTGTQARSIVNSMHENTARRGLRKFALTRLLRTSGTGSQTRSSLHDVRWTYALFTAAVVASIVLDHVLKGVSGAYRLLLIGALFAALIFVLVVRGLGVRPFARKAFGLARSRALLTTPDIDAQTTDVFRALHLTPTPERLLSSTSPTKVTHG